MNDKMKLQSKEFDAAESFANAVRDHSETAVVDDDYPQVRHRYESSLRALIDACRANGRLGKIHE